MAIKKNPKTEIGILVFIIFLSVISLIPANMNLFYEFRSVEIMISFSFLIIGLNVVIPIIIIKMLVISISIGKYYEKNQRR